MTYHTDGMLYCGSNEPVEEDNIYSKTKRIFKGRANYELPIVRVIVPGGLKPRPAIPVMYDPQPDDSDGVPKARTIFHFLDNDEERLLKYRYYQFLDPDSWWRGMGNKEEYILNLNENMDMFEYIGLKKSSFVTPTQAVELKDVIPDIYSDIIEPLNFSLERSLSMNSQLYKIVRPLEKENESLKNRIGIVTQLVKSGNIGELRRMIDAWSESGRPNSPLQYINQLRGGEDV